MKNVNDYYNLRNFADIIQDAARAIIRKEAKEFHLLSPVGKDAPDIMLGDDGMMYYLKMAGVNGVRFATTEPEEFEMLVRLMEPPESLKGALV